MEALKPLKFIGERLAGGGWARLADIVMQNTVEMPDNIIPFPAGVGLPDRPNRPRAV